jgi:Integrase core domain
MSGSSKRELNASWFANLLEARTKIGARKEEYNEERLHSSLEYLGRENLRDELLGAKVKNYEFRRLESNGPVRGARGQHQQLRLLTAWCFPEVV